MRLHDNHFSSASGVSVEAQDPKALKGDQVVGRLDDREN